MRFKSEFGHVKEKPEFYYCQKSPHNVIIQVASREKSVICFPHMASLIYAGMSTSILLLKSWWTCMLIATFRQQPQIETSYMKPIWKSDDSTSNKWLQDILHLEKHSLHPNWVLHFKKLHWSFQPLETFVQQLAYITFCMSYFWIFNLVPKNRVAQSEQIVHF